MSKIGPHLVARVSGASAAALLLLVAWGAPASAAIPAPQGSSQLHLSTQLRGFTLAGESPLSNGDYVTTWKNHDTTVTVAAPAGSTVTVESTGNAAQVGVTTPDKPKPARMTADRLRSADTVIPNALAVGFSPAEAQAMAHKAAAAAVNPMYSPGQIMATPCATMSGDGGHAWSRACDTQKFVQDNGGGNWIIGDAVVGSGNDPYSTGVLTSLKSWVNYGPKNNIFDWSPNATIQVGNCQTYTASAGYNGVGLSASTNVCDQLSPYGVGNPRGFGSQWGTCDWQNYTEGNASTDVLRSPTGASAAVSLFVKITWVTPNAWGGC